VGQSAIEPIDYTTIFQAGHGQSGQRRWTVSNASAPSYSRLLPGLHSPLIAGFLFRVKEHRSSFAKDRGRPLHRTYNRSIHQTRNSAITATMM
jgi:hypothetical protein